MHRVVVTGFGSVSPLGCSVAQLWKAVLAGSTASQNIQNNPNWTHLSETLSTVSCKVFCPIDAIPRRTVLNERIKYPRSFEFLEAATAEALEHARLRNVQNVGVFVGWGMPGTEEVHDISKALVNNPVINLCNSHFVTFI